MGHRERGKRVCEMDQEAVAAIAVALVVALTVVAWMATRLVPPE